MLRQRPNLAPGGVLVTKSIPFSVVATKTFPTVHLAGNTVQADRMITLGALEKMEEQTG